MPSGRLVARFLRLDLKEGLWEMKKLHCFQ